MKINNSIHVRVALAIEQGRKRIRCAESEWDEASRYGIRYPKDGKKYVAAFGCYEDIPSGFFAYFTEAFKIAARKTWNIACKDKEVKK